MEPHTLQFLWYLVIILSLICYAMLDGFDLGVGSLHLFAKDDAERRVFLNAIGPVWDGNEVWLVIVGGALFAGFPDVYATMFSSFYTLTMCFLFCLIFRAVAIEFRSKNSSTRWRQTWDIAFCLASIGIAFGAGIFLGNLIAGISLDHDGTYLGDLADFFNPYALLIGLTTVSLFTMHGSIYLSMKTEEQLHAKVSRWIPYTITFFICCYLVATIVTLLYMPHMVDNMLDKPWLFIFPSLGLLAIANIPLLISKGKDVLAFLTSCLSIAFLLSLFAIGTYPTMIRSCVSPQVNSLTIANSASSPLTLKVLLIIVLIGLPFVFCYIAYVHWLFRGKVKIDKTSY